MYKDPIQWRSQTVYLKCKKCKKRKQNTKNEKTEKKKKMKFQLKKSPAKSKMSKDPIHY